MGSDTSVWDPAPLSWDTAPLSGDGDPHLRNSEVSQRGTQRDAEGSEFSYIGALRGSEWAEVKSEEELRRGRPTSPPDRRSLFGEESPEDAGREASLVSPDLFSPTLVPTSPLDSAYETGRKTPSCCPVEPDTNTHDEAGVVYEAARSSRTAKKREKMQMHRLFGPVHRGPAEQRRRGEKMQMHHIFGPLRSNGGGIGGS